MIKQMVDWYDVERQTTQHQQAHWAVLAELGEQLAQAASLPELAARVLATGCQLVNASDGYLLLVDVEMGELAVVAQQGKRPLTTTTLAHQSYQTSEAAIDNQHSGECALVVPLQTLGQTVGTIHVTRATWFTADDLDLLTAVANMSAGTIQQLRVHEALAQLQQARSAYVSTVTHEMRLPLTAVKGYVDLMSNELVGPLTRQQREFVVVIQRNVRRMSNLLRDLSQINRLESGQLRLEKRPFALPDLVENVAAQFAEKLNGRCQTLTLHLPGDLPTVYADPERVTQILASLLSNAHKYTPSGGHITLTVASTPVAVEVVITDTGIGIAEADYPHLFSQFFRAPSDLVREQSGWGLGLYLVKKLVEIQGGTISCQSLPSQGSTFTFTLPLANR
ncbi:MAG: GAF domain-containing protein [Anaerolineales bacterium]|nr:GAF domain-containing protein [Anaerolineales bacterium]